MTPATENKIENKIETNEFFTIADILESQKFRGMKLRLKPYDPKIFWEGVGDKFYGMFRDKNQIAVNVDWICDRLEQFQPLETILDAGCGFGRMAPFFLDRNLCKKVTGVDVSKSILACSDNYLSPGIKFLTNVEKVKLLISQNPDSPEDVKNELLSLADENDKKSKVSGQQKAAPEFKEKIELLEGDVRDLNFESESFDAVITSEVLQHLSPADAETACSEILRVSKKAVILCERWAFPGEHGESHMWSHNFSEIFSRLGAEILQIIGISNVMQGVVLIKHRGP